MAAPPVPYWPTPKPPYTPTQRQTMVSWLEAFAYSGNPPAVFRQQDINDWLSGKNDKQLHDIYQTYAAAAHSGQGGALEPPNDPPVAPNIKNPLTGLQANLEKWAIRIGEGLAGLLLVGIGINAMTKQRGRSSGGITRTVRTARKVAKTVAK